MVPKSKDWIERLDPDIKLPNFNTGRIMVPERQAVIESLKPTKASTDPVSSSDSVAEPITPLPLLNILQGALPSLKILKVKAKPFPPCTHYGFNDHRLGEVLAESSQSNEPLISLKCDTCGSTVHSTTNHNEFDHFKRGEKIQAAKAREPIKKERIPDINYFHVFRCHVFIHNHKDHLRKFDAKADDGYFLGYSFVSKSFRVLRRQQIKETYHVTFDESMDAIRFTHTLEDEIGNDDSSRYPPDKFLSQENHVPEVIAPNELDIPHTEDTEGLPDLINTEGTPEQNVQNDQLITQPTDVPSGNNTEVSGPITKSLVHDAT
nr:retrovirus-related Pol polyprotein from transposon TNT 1-94 [Tanacetum cinerariifolium]